MPLVRSNSFRRSVAKRNKPDAAPAAPAAGAGGGVCRTGTVLRHNGKKGEKGKWVARFGVLHADAVCLFASPKDWTPFRSFPEEVHLLDPAVTTKVGPSSDGELCLTVDSPTFDAPLMLSMESGEEAEAWQLAIQEAVVVRTGATREHEQRLGDARRAAEAAEAELRAAQAKAGAAAGEPSSAAAGATRLDKLRAQADGLTTRAAETREAAATARAEAAQLADEAAHARDELQHVRQVQMENIVDEVGPDADGPGFFESVIRPRVEAAR